MNYSQINQILSASGYICTKEDFDKIAERLTPFRFYDELLDLDYGKASMKSLTNQVIAKVCELRKQEDSKECPLCGFDKIRTISIYNPFNMSLTVNKSNETHIIAYPAISVKCPICDKSGEQSIINYFNKALSLGQGSYFIAHAEVFGRLEKISYILKTCVNPEELTLLVHRAMEIVERSQKFISLDQNKFNQIEKGA